MGASPKKGSTGKEPVRHPESDQKLSHETTAFFIPGGDGIKGRKNLFVNPPCSILPCRFDMERLPEEILSIIINFADYADLKRLRLCIAKVQPSSNTPSFQHACVEGQ